MEIEARIKVYETETGDATDKCEIKVRSHWLTSQKRVVLVIGKKQYTVLASDLCKAVERCSD